MICPRVSRSSGSDSRVITSVARRLTSSWRSIFFVSCSANVPPMPMPARVDEHVHAAVALGVLGDDAHALVGLPEVRGHGQRVELAPRPPRAARAVRAASVSSYPSSRSVRAIASPIPDDPPVTSADFTRASLWIGAAHGHEKCGRRGGGGRVSGGEEKGMELSAEGASAPPGRFPSAYSVSAWRRSRLTSLARAGGCAAKYSAARLEKLLARARSGRGRGPARRARPRRRRRGLPARRRARARLHGRLLPAARRRPAHVRRHRRDERAERRLRDGRRAAARALDRRVPGGASRTRCSATCFAAADEHVRAAGAILAGGHTIRDEEPKYGLAVVGTVHPDGIWPKAGARPGDALFLTKPLGTGIVLQAAARRSRARRSARGGDRRR